MYSVFRVLHLSVMIMLTTIIMQQCQEAPVSDLPGDLPAYHSEKLGPGVFVFSPDMDMQAIQTLLDTLYARQSGRGSEFTEDRYALLFKPGEYPLDIKVGYYTHVIGLGAQPDEVVVQGAVRSKSRSDRKHVLTNFWRAAENLSVVPVTEAANVWGVSQAAPLRRVHIRGDLQLHDEGYASGGFMADCKVDGTVLAGQQQQWFTRNSELGGWEGGQWNILFMGVDGAPAEDWPEGPVSVVDQMPFLREKPRLQYSDGKFFVFLPVSRENTRGAGWTSDEEEGRMVPLNKFFIVGEGCTASSLNRALSQGKNVLFTPGVYKFDQPVIVSKPGTIVAGLGMPTLLASGGQPAMRIADVDGVTVSGLLFDAGELSSPALLEVGEKGCDMDHSADPTFLYDLFFRVGGALQGSAESCLTVNSNDVYIDHIWLWRADHGKGVGWYKNRGAHGLIVNGDRVTVYGLFNEHFQSYQTLWNGSYGTTWFYQSELPYDPPVQTEWEHDGTPGYASYKVADGVTTHRAFCLGIYSYFRDAPVSVASAVEVPKALEPDIRHIVTFWLNGNTGSTIQSVINGQGELADQAQRKVVW